MKRVHFANTAVLIFLMAIPLFIGCSIKGGDSLNDSGSTVFIVYNIPFLVKNDNLITNFTKSGKWEVIKRLAKGEKVIWYGESYDDVPVIVTSYGNVISYARGKGWVTTMRIAEKNDFCFGNGNSFICKDGSIYSGQGGTRWLSRGLEETVKKETFGPLPK